MIRYTGKLAGICIGTKKLINETEKKTMRMSLIYQETVE